MARKALGNLLCAAHDRDRGLSGVAAYRAMEIRYRERHAARAVKPRAGGKAGRLCAGNLGLGSFSHCPYQVGVVNPVPATFWAEPAPYLSNVNA